MKKNYLMSAAVALAIGFVATSCSKETNLYDEAAAQKLAQYQAQFVQNFGQIDSKQTWGFGESSRAAVTRSMSSNANEWYRTVNVPKPVGTEVLDEKEVVMNYFATTKLSKGVSVNWSDYFIQEVGCSEYGPNMNFLHGGKSAEENDHIENFNAGGDVKMKEVYTSNTDKYSDEIAFVVNGGTAFFSYHNSLDAETYSNYVIIPGEQIDERLAGWYYLGFDFEAHGQDADKQIEADGYYNDWVVRICPGIYTDAKRVIAEDLGTIGDFDFNDVVFDAHFEWDHTVITIQAAGGTLPLKVAGVEVHEALQVGQRDMVNTTVGQKRIPVAIVSVEGNFNFNINNIPVTVENNGAVDVLKAEAGKAPQKICVPTSYKWATERTNIKTAYPRFPLWVQDSNTNQDWYAEPVKGTVYE